MPSLVLHQFRASHFNDKVRWALDYKQLPHRRVSYLPGPHQGPIKKMTGQTATPVLEIDGQYIAGSAAIIERLERLAATPPLYPASADQRQSALEIQTRLDTELGPATRTVAFTVFVKELGYVCRLFAAGEHPIKRALYRAALPVVRPLMAKANGVSDAANVQRALTTTQQLLDWIGEQIRTRPFLVGDRFSVADLTAAALLAPIMKLDHPDMRQAAPVPHSLNELVRRSQAHPAVVWAQGMYRDFRPPACDVG